ncbi:MAG: tRNA (guanosine(46)-N7)-methyltransferase TrmB [Alphaproteobacteria bacterium]|nr:tRNA (guanosine(46)-N7)-methyltransferase TrmB [Alphaproteobacteria bacterium]
MACAKSSDKTPLRGFYGRRAGKKLTDSRIDALETLLPELGIDEAQLEGTLKLADLFPAPPAHTILEIGFGTGEHLLGLMERAPDAGFIGIEPFINGMATFLRDLKPTPMRNVRVFMDDAMMVVDALEDECLDKIYILNPDPWHKARHHKRRIIREDTLYQYARVLKPGGQLISSTDVPDLAEWIVEKTTAHERFDWADGAQERWKTKPDWWIDNKYATKGAKGASEMHYMVFDKTL